MTKLAKLRKGFASGMSEARISDDQWNDEFLPMLADAERYRWLRHGDNDDLCIEGHGKQHVYLLRNETLDQAIDAAIHNNEKE